MGKVAANFRIDKETKQEMKKICEDIEISTGAVFNIFAKKFTRERKILSELIQTLFIGDFLEILFVCFASSSIEYMSLFFGFSKNIDCIIYGRAISKNWNIGFIFLNFETAFFPIFI